MCLAMVLFQYLRIFKVLFFYSFLLISSVLSFVIDLKFYHLTCSIVLFLLAFLVFLRYLALWSILNFVFFVSIVFPSIFGSTLAFFNFNLQF